jgi:PAS domain S-box-containing protein
VDETRVLTSESGSTIAGGAIGSPAELEAILRQVADGITVQDRSGALVYANDAAARLIGFASAAELVATPVPELMTRFEVFGESGEPYPTERLPGRLALEGLASEDVIRYRVRGTGVERWSLVRATPIFDDAGGVRFAVNAFHDITPLKEAEERLAILADAGKLLSSTFDVDATLARIPNLVVPRLADASSVWLEQDGSLRQIARATKSPEHDRLYADLPQAYDLERDQDVRLVRIYRAGEAVFRPEPTDDVFVHSARVDAEAALREALGIRSVMAIPLRARERSLGLLTFTSYTEGRFRETDFEFACELGARISTAIDRAWLYRDARRTASTLDLLLASAPVGIAFFDRTLRFVRVNEAFASMNGRPVDEHLGRTPREVKDQLAVIEPLLEQVLATGERIDGVEFHRGEPGRGRSFAANYYPVSTGDELTGVGVVVEETSARLREELRLRLLAEASETLGSSLDYRRTLDRVARLLVEQLTEEVAIWVVEDGRLVRIAQAHDDSAIEAALAQAPDGWEIEAEQETPLVRAYRSRTSFVSENAAEVARPAVGAHAGGGADVGAAPQSVVVVPLLLGSEPLGVLTLASAERGYHDENDRRLAEVLGRRIAVAIDNSRGYWEAERRAQAAEALAFTAEGVCLLDVEGRVRLWNPAAAAITAIDEQDIVGERLVDVVPSWRRVAEPPAGASAHVVPIEIAGSERWLSVSTARFEGGTVHAFRDLTQERALEQLKSDFISTISHELRTPLAAIYGASMTLQRADIDLAAVRTDELLQVISTEAERLARTINEILWASRLESGTLQLSIESCDGRQLAESVVAAAKTHLPPSLTLELEAAPSIPRVAADPDKVRQVLTNLIDNAVKYSPDGGPIRVAVEPDGRYVRFVVRDSGLGIPAAEQERVFEKFYRLDPHLTRGVGGTGLGLYICRELVHRMDGRISVESQEAKGSTFVVELPVAD